MAVSAQINKIGLLGGSFNPAHQGHVYISEKALELLGLDEIWWLVAAQNPLKEKEGMMPFAMRFAKAKDIVSRTKNIHVSDFEERHSTNYTYDTLKGLKKEFPQHNFVWIMGADNLVQFPKWHKWQELINELPLAIFNRSGYKDAALSGKVTTEFAAYRLENPLQLANAAPPAWIFLDIETPKISATDIREGK